MKRLIVAGIACVMLAGCEVDYSKLDSVAKTVQIDKSNELDETVQNSNVQVDSEEEVAAFENYVKATVTYTVDGDTVDIKTNTNTKEEGEKLRIRMILVNTKESTGAYKDNPEEFGIEARNFTKELLLNKDIWLEYDVEQTDRYGRTLGYIWLKNVTYEYEGVTYHEEEVTINELLLKHGLAHVAVYKPNVKYKERFYAVENEAKKNRVGMWQ